jgi:hypothetical protein
MRCLRLVIGSGPEKAIESPRNKDLPLGIVDVGKCNQKIVSVGVFDQVRSRLGISGDLLQSV